MGATPCIVFRVVYSHVYAAVSEKPVDPAKEIRKIQKKLRKIEGLQAKVPGAPVVAGAHVFVCIPLP